MICSKCGFEFWKLPDGLDGAPTCELCRAVAIARPGYEHAALANALFSKIAREFFAEREDDGDGLPAGDDLPASAELPSELPLLKKGRGRPRKQ